MAFSNIGMPRATPAVLNLIIANVIVFIAQALFGGLEPGTFIDMFALHHYKADEFRLYQLITHMFMHGSIGHLLFNMFALYVFGSTIESYWSPQRFLIFYFLCGIGAAAAQIGSYTYEFRMYDNAVLSMENYQYYKAALNGYTSVGASGAIMGVVAAFGYLFPNTEMMMMFIPFPIKAKWYVLGIIAIDLFSGVAGRPGDNVAHFAHLGGALTGFLIVFIQNKRNKTNFY